MPTVNVSLTPSCSAFANGVDAVAGTSDKWRIRVSGTWAIGDLVTLTLFYNGVQHDLGNGPMMGVVPVFVTVYKDQVFLCYSDKVYFSGIQEPTGFENRFAGYGFIQLSGQRGEALESKAVAPYSGKLALFARNNVQIWLPNADPDLWQLEQTLDNIGTASSKSVTSFGDMDVLFLADTGVRSIRSRESLDLATVSDVGLFIDKLIRAKTGKTTAVGLYSTLDGRFWLVFSDEIYVFSYVQGAKIAAWTVYKPNIYVGLPWVPGVYTYALRGDAAVKDGVFYLRAYFPSVSTDEKYDELFTFPSTSAYASTVTIVLPFFDAKKPATKKRWHSMDISGAGTWAVSFGNKVTDATTLTATYTSLTLPTEQYERLPIGQIGTHLVVKLTQAASEINSEGYISSIIIHYDELDAK